MTFYLEALTEAARLQLQIDCRTITENFYQRKSVKSQSLCYKKEIR